MARMDLCEAAAGKRTGHEVNGELLLETDERGGFCVVGKAKAAKGTLVVHFAGARFTTPPNRGHGRSRHGAPRPNGAEVRAGDRDDRSRSRGAHRHGLAARRPRGGGALRRLARHEARGSHAVARGRARNQARRGNDRRRWSRSFRGEDGFARRARCRRTDVRFGGTAALAKSSASQAVMRHAEVHLALAHPVASADLDEGAVLDIDVSIPFEDRSESASSRRSVGQKALAQRPSTKARRTSSPPSHRRPRARCKCASATRLHHPGSVLDRSSARTFRSPHRASCARSCWPWSCSAWPRGSSQGGGARRSPSCSGWRPAHNPPLGRPGLQVLRGEPGFAGWRGVVTDAHDGSPIRGRAPRGSLRQPSKETESSGMQ